MEILLSVPCGPTSNVQFLQASSIHTSRQTHSWKCLCFQPYGEQGHAENPRSPSYGGASAQFPSELGIFWESKPFSAIPSQKKEIQDEIESAWYRALTNESFNLVDFCVAGIEPAAPA